MNRNKLISLLLVFVLTLSSVLTFAGEPGEEAIFEEEMSFSEDADEVEAFSDDVTDLEEAEDLPQFFDEGGYETVIGHCYLTPLRKR